MTNEERGYWALWAKIWKRWGIPNPLRDDFRHRVVEVALGEVSSQRTWSHRQFDQVFHLQRRILTEGPAFITTELERQDAAEAGRRRRLIWKCEQAAPAPYLRAVAADKFGCENYSDLTTPQLRQLLYTVTARSQRHDLFSDLSTPSTSDVHASCTADSEPF